MFFTALVYYYFIIPQISKAISTAMKGLVRNLLKFIYDEKKGFRGEYKTFSLKSKDKCLICLFS